MHEKQENQSHFMKTIESITSSEQEADAHIAKAHAQADEVIKQGKERIAKMKADTTNELVMIKNKSLQKGNEAIGKEIEQLLARARVSSQQYKKLKLSDKELSGFLKQLLSL